MLMLLLLNRSEFERITCTGMCIVSSNVKRGSVLPLLADGMMPEKMSSHIDSRIHLNRLLALWNRVLNAIIFFETAKASNKQPLSEQCCQDEVSLFIDTRMRWSSESEQHQHHQLDLCFLVSVRVRCLGSSIRIVWGNKRGLSPQPPRVTSFLPPLFFTCHLLVASNNSGCSSDYPFDAFSSSSSNGRNKTGSPLYIRSAANLPRRCILPLRIHQAIRSILLR